MKNKFNEVTFDNKKLAKEIKDIEIHLKEKESELLNQMTKNKEMKNKTNDIEHLLEENQML